MCPRRIRPVAASVSRGAAACTPAPRARCVVLWGPMGVTALTTVPTSTSSREIDDGRVPSLDER